MHLRKARVSGLRVGRDVCARVSICARCSGERAVDDEGREQRAGGHVPVRTRSGRESGSGAHGRSLGREARAKEETSWPDRGTSSRPAGAIFGSRNARTYIHQKTHPEPSLSIAAVWPSASVRASASPASGWILDVSAAITLRRTLARFMLAARAGLVLFLPTLKRP